MVSYPTLRSDPQREAALEEGRIEQRRSMLTVNELCKVLDTDRGTVRPVHAVSFEIRQGEFYTLLGPSGCGKTTTLQCVAGLEQADAGEVVMGGQVVFSSAQRINVPG